jgi:hypothetical protein
LQLREVGHSNSNNTSNGSGSGSGGGTVRVQGMSVYRVYSKEDVMALLRKGLRNRATRATDANQESSRSHTIVQLFTQVEEADEHGLVVLKKSTFSLVDLAGYVPHNPDDITSLRCSRFFPPSSTRPL